MQPLATYRERRFDGQRTFHLHSEVLSFVGKQSLGGEFEMEIPLATLLPIANRLRVRDPGFGAGIVMLICAVGLFQGGAVALLSYWGGLVAVMGIGGVLLSLATARKVEWVQFSSSAGVVAVSVARSGPDRAQFDDFVAKLVQQIKASVPVHAPET